MVQTESDKGYLYRLIPAIGVSFILGAHFMRLEQPGLVVVALLSPLLLIFKQRWTLIVYQILLFAGCAHLIQTMSRSIQGSPWPRSGIIMSSVSFLTLISLFLLNTRSIRMRYNKETSITLPSVASFIAVVVFCLFPHIKMRHPVPLIAERLLPGSGWIEIVLLGLYAGWLSGKLTQSRLTAPIRRNVWTLFSIIFFVQLVLGISGFSLFLMSGKLHFPIPALIIAGPIYRGTFALFMPLLLITTLIIAGPAWCSWFCYLGSWDFIASRTVMAGKLNTSRSILTRISVLSALIFVAVFLRLNSLPVIFAITGSLLFGLISIAIIAAISKKKGIMFHCTSFCPIGLLTTTVGKINPFRIRIGEKCCSCHVCIKSCRYGALTKDQIQKKAPGFTCTLCGDCLSGCPTSQIEYRIPGLKPQTARSLFMVLVVVIHTIFLGFARI